MNLAVLWYDFMGSKYFCDPVIVLNRNRNFYVELKILDIVIGLSLSVKTDLGLKITKLIDQIIDEALTDSKPIR